MLSPYVCAVGPQLALDVIEMVDARAPWSLRNAIPTFAWNQSEMLNTRENIVDTVSLFHCHCD